MKLTIPTIGLIALLLGACAAKPPAPAPVPKSSPLPDHKLAPIERAIVGLPPQFVADIPLTDRAAFLGSLHSDPADTRLDTKRGYLHFYSDGGDHGAVGGTSMLYMRQYRKSEGGLVFFTHMPKPVANSRTIPSTNQTFFFERRKGKWIDVTSEVLPAGIDLRNHFRPHRTDDNIDIAPYVRRPGPQGEAPYCEFGAPVLQLRWDGRVFHKHRATAKTLSDEPG